MRCTEVEVCRSAWNRSIDEGPRERQGRSGWGQWTGALSDVKVTARASMVIKFTEGKDGKDDRSVSGRRTRGKSNDGGAVWKRDERSVDVEEGAANKGGRRIG